MKINAVSVIVMAHGTVDSVDTFTNGDEAEKAFAERVREIFDGATDRDIETAIENGCYDYIRNGKEVLIVHSFGDEHKPITMTDLIVQATEEYISYDGFTVEQYNDMENDDAWYTFLQDNVCETYEYTEGKAINEMILERADSIKHFLNVKGIEVVCG